MENTRPYWKVIVSLVFGLIVTVFVIGASIWLLRLFLPFVIGWIISCIANPVVCWLDKKLKIKKKLGSVLMIIVVLGAVVGLLYLIGSMLVKETGDLIKNLPAMYKEVEVQLTEIADSLSGLLDMLPKGLKSAVAALGGGLGNAVGDWVKNLSEPTVSMAGNVAKQIPTIVIGTFVVILSAYFFVADRDSVTTWTKTVVPKSIYERLAMVISNFKTAVGGYFLAQFKIMVIVWLILLLGLSLLKVQYAILLSILIAFLDFLPFFGTGTAFVPWCIYTVLTGDYLRALFLAIIYIVTQVFHQMVQPKLIGDEVGLKPLPTLVFIYLGYKLGGVLWMILAVPVGMITINMVKAGAFDYILNDVKILIKGIKSLRE